MKSLNVTSSVGCLWQGIDVLYTWNRLYNFSVVTLAYHKRLSDKELFLH